MKSFVTIIAAGLLLSTGLAQGPAAAAPASSVRRLELPVETSKYRDAAGVQLALTFCVTCHSAEYAENQAPLPDAYWEGTVKKMKEKFGAPIPNEAMAELTKYFITAYGSGRKP